ncbi:MAG TPA: citryl-CoA lyase [Candidatus Nanoarchaeia archaeon]|nr:citryl-CoA lyase [Candidatus Nanoarchaeia archaeon]
MEWKTKIGLSTAKETLVRGYDLVDLIGRLTFTEAIYLVLRGELPGAKEVEMLNALFVASIEHGIFPPSTTVARIVASCGADFNDSLAAGVLAISTHHGGAVQQSAMMLQEQLSLSAEEIVKTARTEKRKLSGYGHKIYTTDPRTIKLFSIAERLGFGGIYVKKSLDIEKELEKQIGKKLCLNIDGAIATIISELGFSWKLSPSFFILPRIVGISAHIYEELSQANTYRRLDETGVIYEGEVKRKLP